MKKVYNLRIAIAATVFMIAMGFTSLKAQFLYRSTTGSHLFLGPLPVNNASAGSNPNFFIGPNFGIEYNCGGSGGLDFFIPWGSSYNYNQNVIHLGSNGNVGISMMSNTYSLAVNGGIWTTQGVYISSDGTLKRNIKDMKEQRSEYVNKLKLLKGKTYEKLVATGKDNASEINAMVAAGKIPKEEAASALQYLNERKKDTYKSEYGFIAQEVKELFPELVRSDEKGLLAINYTGLIPVLLEAIKDLQDRVEQLEQQTGTKDVTARISGITSNDAIAENSEYLSQNVPNPVDGSTVIRYSLPQGATQAAIAIYSNSGGVSKIIPLDTKARSGSVTLYASDLAKGVNVYNLTANGVLLGSRKLVNP
jgi:hypothetical protein